MSRAEKREKFLRLRTEQREGMRDTRDFLGSL